MPNTPLKKKPEAGSAGWSVVIYVVVITIAVDAALFISSAAGRSWMSSAATMIAAALISGGTLFTIMEMANLGDRRSR